MRGGTANCNVKISDEEIPSPYCQELDIACTLNDASIDKFEKQIRPGGILLVNSSLARGDRTYRKDIRVILIPCTDIANEVGTSKGANIVMLGALAFASADFDHGYMRQAVLHFFEKKGKGKFNEKNAACFDKGVEAAHAQGA